MNENPESWTSASEQLNELCIKVGLDRAPDLPSPGIAISAPAGTALWSSSYALVLLWPCRGGDYLCRCVQNTPPRFTSLCIEPRARLLNSMRTKKEIFYLPYARRQACEIFLQRGSHWLAPFGVCKCSFRTESSKKSWEDG